MRDRSRTRKQQANAGAGLFERESRNVSLRHAGRVLLDHARRVFVVLEDAVRATCQRMILYNRQSTTFRLIEHYFVRARAELRLDRVGRLGLGVGVGVTGR